MNLFSKRSKPIPDTLKYSFDNRVRQRVIHVFRHFATQGESLHGMFSDVKEACYLAYGELSLGAVNILEHASHCSNERFIDFIELCFKSTSYGAGQQGVDIINHVLRDEGIGYEFSPYTETMTQIGSTQCYLTPTIYPLATKKSDDPIHTTTVMPALAVLAAPHFQGANTELLKAHEHFRKGEFVASINSAGQAYESVFKIICSQKKWEYESKDTLKALVDICYKKQLFESFYVEILKNPGTIRNNLGSHGTGDQKIIVTPHQAEHMIQFVSSNILLLTRLAKI